MSTLAEQARELKATRDAMDDANASYKDLKKEYDQKHRALRERMEQEEVDSVKTDGVNFVAAATRYGNVEDREAFIAWAEEEQPELLQIRERGDLLNELVRECLDDGRALPPGLGYYVKEYVSQRAA